MFQRDNTIQLVFEKIFDQKTQNGAELLKIPFEQIKMKTFNCDAVHKLVHQLTKRPLSNIIEYLSSDIFQKKFLFDKINKKNLIKIFFNVLIDDKYIIDDTILKSCIINNRIDCLKKINHIKFTNDLLLIAAEFAYEEIYFYLREKNLFPNSQTFYRAVLGGSIKIIEDINSVIAISDKIMELAFEMNRTDVILFLVSNSEKINPNLMSYPIMNCNYDILEKLNYLIVWHEELYFSALLSGSMEMIKFVERQMDVHKDYLLDTSKSGGKGQMSLLVEEMMYQRNGKTYFSHTINYAIQSQQIDVIKYITSLGYCVTSSNVITAIKTGNVEIALYIAQQYGKKLESHIIYYFGVKSYIPNKIKIAAELINHGYLDLHCHKQKQINDYRRETLHQKMIEDATIYINPDEIDVDYLMMYHQFFTDSKNVLITKIRLALELDLDITWDMYHPSVIDCIYLFGNLNQIKKFIKGIPDIRIIMETLCYNQIGKLCYLIQNHNITSDIINQLSPVIVMLSDPLLNAIIEKFQWNVNSDLKYLLLSGKKFEYTKELTKNDIKEILMMEDITLVEQFDIIKKIDNEIIRWIHINDLIDILGYLNNNSLELYNETF